jgi:hypothetical protein
VKKSIFLIAVLMFTTVLGASDDKKPARKVADAGSFGIFVNGNRVATETFHIEEGPEVSTATSEIKVSQGGSVQALQTAEMQVTTKGDLRLYTWRSSVPAKEETTVVPNDQLLVEHLTTADLKKLDVPYLLPLSTVILDDNFFSHREILLWRYLASGCTPKSNGLACNPSQFSFLNPRQHASGTAMMALAGPEKVTVNGVAKDLTKIRLDVYDGAPTVHMMDESSPQVMHWFLWIDANFMVIKMAVPANNVEVVRD